jgi:hypothetical protein
MPRGQLFNQFNVLHEGNPLIGKDQVVDDIG